MQYGTETHTHTFVLNLSW